MCLSFSNMGVHKGAAHVMFLLNITLLDVSPTLIFRVRSVLQLLSRRPLIGTPRSKQFDTSVRTDGQMSVWSVFGRFL